MIKRLFNIFNNKINIFYYSKVNTISENLLKAINEKGTINTQNQILDNNKPNSLFKLEILKDINNEHNNNTHYVNIKCSLNNTFVTLCRYNHQILFTKSCGSVGFKKSKRGGYEPAYKAMCTFIETVNNKNLKVNDIILKFNGFGPGREACFQALRANTNWNIIQLLDVTPIPHNGCRPPKKRRI